MQRAGSAPDVIKTMIDNRLVSQQLACKGAAASYLISLMAQLSGLCRILNAAGRAELAANGLRPEKDAMCNEYVFVVQPNHEQNKA